MILVVCDICFFWRINKIICEIDDQSWILGGKLEIGKIIFPPMSISTWQLFICYIIINSV